MTAPPTRLAPKHNPHPTAGRPASEGPRRAVILRCDDCSATATAIVRGNRLISSNLPIRRHRSWRHLDCGGVVRGYDIEVGS